MIVEPQHYDVLHEIDSLSIIQNYPLLPMRDFDSFWERFILEQDNFWERKSDCGEEWYRLRLKEALGFFLLLVAHVDEGGAHAADG